MKKIFLILLMGFISFNLSAAAAFAEAFDAEGNGVTWTFYTDDSKNAKRACIQARKNLQKQGQKKVRCNVSTSLVKGHYAVLFTAFWVDGKLRKRFSFGFSGKSGEDAKKNAEKNLQKHIKGWTKNDGFVVREVKEF
ncbi:MAG: hypothetical protein R6W70_02910 [bacterium]